MIQSYLFDPVQVPSPGYVNEVSGCKLDEEDTVKLRGKPGGEVPAHRHDLPRDGLRRTGSRARRPGPPGDPEKPGGALNGIGPAGDPGPPQGGAGAWASTARSVAPAHPSPDTDRAPPAPGEARAAGDGDAGVSPEAEGPAVDRPDPAPQIPAPDYPPHRDLVDHGAKEEDLQGHPEEEEEERLEEERTGSGEQGPDLPSSLPGKRSWGSGRRSWGSVNGAVAAEALSVHLAEEDPAADRRAGCAPGGDGAAPAEEEEEDAEVAEALAALAAATAGEEADDAD